ncbi:Metallo-dependent phosphatase-like protein [Paraphysoderma sedebokerense]|nr:Metallo-dependent phosphatase-like protein [Paraphysoderma sedebokerense]
MALPKLFVILLFAAIFSEISAVPAAQKCKKKYPTNRSPYGSNDSAEEIRARNDHHDAQPSSLLSSAPSSTLLANPSAYRNPYAPPSHYGSPQQPIEENPVHGLPSQPGLVIPPPLPNDKKSFKMTIIHTNDIHAHQSEFNNGGTDCNAKDIEKGTCYGGIARIKTMLDKLRAERKNTYLFDAGDQFQGTLFYNYYKGNVSAEYMNDFGYDVMTLGNHEFDDGPALLAKFIRMLKFPVVSANMDTSRNPDLHPLVVPYTVLTKYNTRIGVIGYITNTTGFISNAGSTITFFNAVEKVQAAVDHLKKQGIEKIVCVSHNGYFDDIWLAERTKGISAIVGGHSHSLLLKNASVKGVVGTYPTAVKNLDGKNTYVVQAKSWGMYLGVFELEWNDQGDLTKVDGDPILLDQSIKQDPIVLAKVGKWREPFQKLAAEVLGTSNVALEIGTCNNFKTACYAGLLINQAMLKTYRGNYSVIALMNGGGIRAGIGIGEITWGQVQSMLPFGNALVMSTVNGTFIKQALENLAAKKNFAQSNRRVTSFAQFGNLNFTITYTAPENARVTDIMIKSSTGEYRPINMNENYDLVTNDFVASGGDGILPSEVKGPAGDNIADVVISYVRSVKKVEYKTEDLNWLKVVGEPPVTAA